MIKVVYSNQCDCRATSDTRDIFFLQTKYKKKPVKVSQSAVFVIGQVRGCKESLQADVKALFSWQQGAQEGGKFNKWFIVSDDPKIINRQIQQ